MEKSKLRLSCLAASVLLGTLGGLASCNNGRSSSTSGEATSGSGKTESSDSKDLLSSSIDLSSETSSSVPISSSESSEDYSDGHFRNWNARQQALMETYAGDVLPYPVGMLNGNVKAEQYYNEDYDYYFLQISDESESFTIRDYYKWLVSFGWSVISSYKEPIFKIDSSETEYVELTKPGEKGVGYQIVYFYVPSYQDDEGNEVKGGNFIRCYSDLVSSSNGLSAWSETDASRINQCLLTDLPFIQMASDYGISFLSVNSLYIGDSYVNDLTKSYSDLLIEDGFELSEEESEEYNSYFLKKENEDGSYIEAMLYYSSGNAFIFSYTPKEKVYSSWPTDVMDEIKEQTGVEVPECKIKEGGTFTYYKKNNTHYLYTESLLDKTDFDYELYAESILQDPGLSWEETISFSSAFNVDDDENKIAYLLAITICTPTSTFVSSYPSDDLNEFITEYLGIKDVDIPSFDESSLPNTGKQVKYSTQGKDVYDEYYEYYVEEISTYPYFYDLGDNPSKEEIEEEAKRLAFQQEGFSVSIYDVSSAACASYEGILYKSFWYETKNFYGQTVYEDPNGKLAVTFSTYEDPSKDGAGVTTITFNPGSGVKHKEEFFFAEESYDIAPGSYKFPDLVKSMLPYDVTYSSDTEGVTINEYGAIEVSSAVAVGTKATITALINVPEKGEMTATCTVNVIEPLDYSVSKILKTIATRLSDKGYEAEKTTSKNAPDCTFLIANLGTSLTYEEAKAMVKEDLVPTGFKLLEVDGDWCSDEFNECGHRNAERAAYYCQDGNETWILTFYAFVEDGNTYVMAMAH